MKGGILAAWLAGMGILSWRAVEKDKRIPAPGVLLAVTGLFVAGGLVAEWVPASEPLVLATLVGLDVAAFLNVLPQGLSGQLDQATKAEKAAVTPAAAKGGGGPLLAPGG